MNVILNLFSINLRLPYGMLLAITPMMMPFSLLNDFLQRVGILNLYFLWAKSSSIKVGLAVIIYQSQFDKVGC